MTNGHINPMFLLINTPNYLYQEGQAKMHQVYSPPLGLGYIASHLDESGIPVAILDAEAHQLSVNEIVRKITRIPGLKGVGLNTFTPNLPIIREVVRRLPKRIQVVLGGPHITVAAREVLKDPVFHRCILISGEAEFKLRELLMGRGLREIPGLSFMDGTEAVHIHDEVQNPEWIPYELDELKLNHEFLTAPVGSKSEGRAVILTTRGCPYVCTFCSGAFGKHQPKVRMRSTDDIARELRELDAKGIHDIKPLDDLFLLNERRARAVLEAIDGLPFADKIQLRVHGRVNSIVKYSEKTMELMGKYVIKVMVGIESGNQRMLDMLRKGIKLEIVTEAIDRMTKYGISVSGYFMIGLPTETEAEVQETLELARELKAIAANNPGEFTPVTYVYRPYPGTKLWDLYNEAGVDHEAIMTYKELSLDDGDSEGSLVGRGLIDMVPTQSLHFLGEDKLKHYLREMRALGNQIQVMKEFAIPHRSKERL